MLDWLVTRPQILLQKLLYYYRYVTWLFLIPIATYSCTKIVATCLEVWNLKQAACGWTKGERNPLFCLPAERGLLFTGKELAHLSFAQTLAMRGVLGLSSRVDS